MTWLAVPLLAYAQGLSNAQIGVLFALPVLAQAPLNLVGGAYTDRIGGRRILLGSCVATIAAGLWFIFAHGFWMLLAGQAVFVIARAAFWPANWAMRSEEHTSELQSQSNLVCRLLLEKKKRRCPTRSRLGTPPAVLISSATTWLERRS